LTGKVQYTKGVRWHGKSTEDETSRKYPKTKLDSNAVCKQKESPRKKANGGSICTGAGVKQKSER